MPHTGFADLVVHNDREYAQCSKCKGFGRPRWAHSCMPGGSTPHGNWHATPEILELERPETK